MQCLLRAGEELLLLIATESEGSQSMPKRTVVERKLEASTTATTHREMVHLRTCGALERVDTTIMVLRKKCFDENRSPGIGMNERGHFAQKERDKRLCYSSSFM